MPWQAEQQGRQYAVSGSLVMALNYNYKVLADRLLRAITTALRTDKSQTNNRACSQSAESAPGASVDARKWRHMLHLVVEWLHHDRAVADLGAVLVVVPVRDRVLHPVLVQAILKVLARVRTT